MTSKGIVIDKSMQGTRKAREVKAREASGEVVARDGGWVWAA